MIIIQSCIKKGKLIRQHFSRLFSELGPAAQMNRGLVKRPAEGTGASLGTPLAEGTNALGVLCRMAGAVPTAVRKTRTRIRKHRPASL